MRKIKIFLTTLAIAGVLFATSSCVDDSESASVTDLRGAKSAQLKAQADLAKAQATAATRLAEAEYLKAENDKIRAEGEKAIADARAAAIEAKTDIEKAKAAELLRQTIEEVNYQVAYQQGETQKYNLELAADILKLELQLKLAQVTANLALKDSLQMVVGEYGTLVTQLNLAKQGLTTASVNLLKEELTLIAYKDDTVKLIENYKLSLNADIRKTEKRIERLTKAIAEYQKVLENPNPSIAPLIAAKEVALQKAKDTLPVLYQAKVLADTAKNQAYAVYEADSLVREDYLAVTEGNYVYYGYSQYSGYTTIPEWTWGTYTFKYRGPKDGTYQWSGYLEYYNENIYARYDAATGRYYWYWEYSNLSPQYVSKEDYLHKVSIEELKKDTAKYAKELRDLYTRVNALPALISAAGEDEATKKVTLDAAEKALQDSLEVFYAKPLPQSSADTSNVNKAKTSYDGTKYRPNTDFNDNLLLIVDTAGSAKGKWKLANDYYSKLLYEEKTITNTGIPDAKKNYADAAIKIDEYDAILAILSTGPLVDLNDKVTASDADYKAKEKLFEEAEGLYNDWSDETQTLYDDIITLTGYEVSGLFTDTINNKTAYIEDVKENILAEIDAYTIKKNQAEIALADYKAKLDAAALHGGYEKVIRDKEDNIANYKAQIKEYEAKIVALEAQLDIVTQTIDALLKLVNETEGE